MSFCFGISAITAYSEMTGISNIDVILHSQFYTINEYKEDCSGFRHTSGYY